jgi:acyl dehydratase
MYVRICGLFVVLTLAAAGVAAAQETTGTISGRIVDPQGLAVPGATVTLTGSQGTRTVVTGTEGRFSAPFLTPGTYTVRAELSGFRPVEQRNVNVSLGQTLDLDLQLAVGGLAETVQVEAAAPIIDTRSATVGTVLGSGHAFRLRAGSAGEDGRV